jgi:hypothetical protein
MATRVEAFGSNGRVELITDNVTKEIARIVVENDDGTKAFFFVSLSFDKKKKPRMELIAKRKNATESEAHVSGDWIKPNG